MSSYLRARPISCFVQLSLVLTQLGVAGSPLPPSTDDDKLFQPEVRSLTGDGPLQDWEIAILILGALFGIMLLGALGGICEVILGGKIKQSNAEADAKLENIGKRDMADDAEGGKLEGGAAEGPNGAIDPSRYSWQPERMTTNLSDDSTLAGSEPEASQSDISRGGQSMAAEGEWEGDSRDAQQIAYAVTQEQHAQANEQYETWDGSSLPHPDSSQFVIDDVDSPGYGGHHGNFPQTYEAYPGHLNPPPAMPKTATYPQQETADLQGNQEGEAASYYAGYSSEAKGDDPAFAGSTGQSTMPAPGPYSGEGYSPAAMPDSADYLHEYRQSQLYLQHDDDWYGTASAKNGAPAGTAQ
jgi:hypothetical protein